MGAILKLENICKYYYSNNTVSLGLNKINLNMNFCGLDLSKIPQQNLNDWTVYIIPALYIISTFISIMDAHKKTKINRQSIQYCLQGKQKYAKGFIFEYI